MNNEIRIQAWANVHFRLGCRAFADNQYGEALSRFAKSAALGHGEAAFRAGVMYSWGLGVPEDKQLARRYYLAAWNRGYKAAELLVNMVFADGMEMIGEWETVREWLAEERDREIRRIEGLLAVGHKERGNADGRQDDE